MRRLLWTRPKEFLTALLVRRYERWRRQGEDYLRHWQSQRLP